MHLIKHPLVTNGRDSEHSVLHKELFDASKLLVSKDVLTIELQFELLKNPKPLEEQELTRALEPNQLLEREQWLNNKQFSDFSFICNDGVEIHANKSIILSHYPETGAQISTELEQNESQKISVTDISAETMMELLRFVYCGYVNNIDRIALNLLQAAVKYEIEDLTGICLTSLVNNPNLTEGNVMMMLEVANTYNEKHLKDNCIDFIKW